MSYKSIKKFFNTTQKHKSELKSATESEKDDFMEKRARPAKRTPDLKYNDRIISAKKRGRDYLANREDKPLSSRSSNIRESQFKEEDNEDSEMQPEKDHEMRNIFDPTIDQLKPLTHSQLKEPPSKIKRRSSGGRKSRSKVTRRRRKNRK